MLHAAHKTLAVDRVAAVAGEALAHVLRAAFELCSKVWLADERAAHRHERETLCKDLLRSPAREHAADREERNADPLARRLERVQIERRLLPRAAVEVDAADLRSVHAAAFVELQQRRQAAAAVAVGLDDHREIRAARLAHRAQNALDEAEAVFQAPAVLVRTQVFLRIQKVREQVPVRVVDLHAVRAAVLALFRRKGELLNQPVELFQGKILGVLGRRAVHALDALDTAVAELEEKLAAVLMHTVAGAAEKRFIRRLIHHGLARVGALRLINAEMAGDDEADLVFRKLDERIRPERRHLTLFVRQMLVRRRADDAVFKLARAELCRGKQEVHNRLSL